MKLQFFFLWKTNSGSNTEEIILSYFSNNLLIYFIHIHFKTTGLLPNNNVHNTKYYNKHRSEK